MRFFSKVRDRVFISKMAEFGMINQTDVSLVNATDSVEEAIRPHITDENAANGKALPAESLEY